MAEIREKGAFVNPYVVQMDKFADSMVHLSKTFFTLEGYKGTFSKEEFEEMFGKITDKVCENCERRDECLHENRVFTYQMVYEILCAVEEYGAELDVELKRGLKRKCILAPRFLRETLEVYENAKKILLWNNRIVQNREGFAGQLKSFAKLLQYTTRELDAGIFEDEHLEKKLKSRLKKIGVKMLSSVFYITPQGKYELHLTVKAAKGICVATKELAYETGACIGRVMMPQQGERPIVGAQYCTIACVESARYQTLQGVAKIGKDCEQISGDTFLMTDLPGGKKGVALSDGMGSGEEACRESTMVVEMLEELLETGFPAKTAIEIMNTALVIGREDVRFSTVDACLFDLYTGYCEFIKAGAAATFIKRLDGVEKVSMATLPIGVIKDLEIESVERELESGEFVIMVTDGVMDALPVKEQDTLMAGFIQEANTVNPKEMAHCLLGRVLEWSQEKPTDDMTIVVVGLWKL